MKNAQKSPSKVLTSPRRKLYLAVAAQLMLSAGAHAGPTGGKVTGGDGVIDQNGLNTTITQNTQRLALDWDSFNIDANERVEFVQPNSSSVALNRVLSNDASNIFGQLDANGHVILMNPNGIFFGKDATVNVGGLVASGLAINPDDFMNGDFAFSAVDGTDGAVINRGVINAATGGNVALMGKSVANEGLISAKLGTVTLAAGNQSVLTFDDSGMLGVRVTEEVLQSELGVDAAVSNSGDINAEGGKILLTGSVSQDIFTKAVNAGDLNADTSVIMHDDGSFTLGGGADVVNTGNLNVASTDSDAGDVVVLGENVTHSGNITASSTGTGKAGHVEVHAQSTTLLTENSTINATAVNTGKGGDVKVLGDRVGVFDQSTIDATGMDGGGNINIGGGFQGKNDQLRNASRTVVTSETQIKADAIANGDGGEVIVWADETAAFTGDISVRGGELSGDGGFVEVSGKQNLKFDGRVDRTAANGESGTLLLDPEYIQLQREPADNNDELADGLIDFEDVGDPTTLTISDVALGTALDMGDVILKASRGIGIFEPSNTLKGSVEVSDPESTSSLIMEAPGSISLGAMDFNIGAGNLIVTAGVSDCGAVACTLQVTDGIQLRNFTTSGDIYLRARGSVSIDGVIGEEASGLIPSSLNVVSTAGDMSVSYAEITVAGDVNLSAGPLTGSQTIQLPSGDEYITQELIAVVDGDIGQEQASVESIFGSPVIKLGGDLNVVSNSIFRFEDILVDTSLATGEVNLNFTQLNEINNFASRLPTVNSDAAGTPIGAGLPVNIRVDAVSSVEVGNNLFLGSGTIDVTSSDGGITVSRWTEGGGDLDWIMTAGGGISFADGVSLIEANSMVAAADSFSFLPDSEFNIVGGLEFRSNTDIELPVLNVGGDLNVGSNTNGTSIAITSALTSELKNSTIGGDVVFSPGALGSVKVVSNTTTGFQPAGSVSVAEAASASILILGDGLIGDINISGDFEFWAYGPGSVGLPGPRIDDVGIINVGGKAGIASSTPAPNGSRSGQITLDNLNNSFGTLGIAGGSVDLDYMGDLQVEELVVSGGPNGTESYIRATGNIEYVGRTDFTYVAQTNLSADLVPINFDAGGDIIFTSDHHQFASVNIVNAQNAIISNSTDLNIAGINAQNFTLNATDAINVTQTGAITVAGETLLHAGEVLGVEGVSQFTLRNPENDFNVFSANVGQGVIMLDDANDIALGDVSASILFQVSSLGASSTISQTANSSIDIASQLNLYAANLNLGAGGTAAINLGGGNLNANTSNLTIDGTITDGLLDIQSLNLGGESLGLQTVNIAASADLSTIIERSKISMGGADAVANISAALPFTLFSFAENSTVNLLAEGAGAAGIDFSLATGISTVAAFDADNTWQIDALGNTSLNSGGTPIEILGATSLVGGSGNDTFSFAAFDPASAIAVVGGDGAGIDTVDYSLAEEIIDLTLGANTGVTGVERIVGNNLDSILRVDPESTTANVWEVRAADSSVTIGDGATTLFEGFNQLVGGGGVDEFNLFTTITGTIDGGAGNDIFNQAAADVSANILGGDGVDTLNRFAEGEATWNITGANSGTLQLTDSAPAEITFTGVEDLAGDVGVDHVVFTADSSIGTITTGADDDTLALAPNATYTSIDGGAGTNTVAGEGETATVNVFGQAELLNEAIANFVATAPAGATLTVVGIDGLNAEWFITGEGIVNVVVDGVTYTHENVVNLQGGTGADVFVLQQGGSIAGTVTGQDVTDTLHADNAQGNQWTLDGGNSGQVTAVTDGTTLIFEGIAYLIGSEGSDVFEVAAGGALTGSLRGIGYEAMPAAGSVDSLTISNQDVTNTWTLGEGAFVDSVDAFGAASRIRFSEIQGLRGNNQVDTIDMSALGGSVDLLLSEAGGYSITSMENFVSAGGAMKGTDFDSEWILGANGAVSYTDADGTARTVTFANFGSFTGGRGRDTFIVNGVWQDASVSIVGGELADTVQVDIDNANTAWYFSTNPTLIYVGGPENTSLVGLSRGAAQDALQASQQSFHVSGIESYVGSSGSDAFFALGDSGIYGDSDLDDPAIDGRGGDDYLLAFNYGAPENLVWNITEDFGGRINEGVRFSNIEHLKSNEFLQLEAYAGLSSTFFVGEGVTISSLTADSSGAVFDLGAGATVGSVTGGAGTDTLFAGDAEKTWTLDAIGGSVGMSTFTGIEALTGGAATDTFTVTSVTTEVVSIDGGADSIDDRIIAADAVNTWALAADADTSGTLNETLGFSNIDVLQGGADVDTIIGGDRANEWSVTTDFAGSVNNLLAFENIENITGNAGVDTMTVTAGVTMGDLYSGGGDDVITIGEGATISNIFAEAGSDTVTLGDLVTITGIVDGGTDGVDDASVDILDISAFSSANEFNFLTGESSLGFTRANFEQEIGTAGSSIFSGDGDFTWTFNADNTFTITGEGQSGTFGVEEYSSIRAGAGEHSFIFDEDARFAGNIQGDAAGTNSLTANNLIDTWVISGLNSGTMSGEEGALVTTFTNIANIIGSANAETFTVEAGGSIASISGGTGADILRIADAAAINNWQLGATNSVELVAAFDGIETIVGNELADTVNYAAGTEVVNIQGGAGEANVLVSADALAVNLGTGLLDETVSFSNINSFTAAGGSIAGADEANTWTLNAGDSGTVATATNSVAFTGFNTLTGGADVDTLVGTDAGSAYAITGENAGSVDAATTFSGMENLTAGAGADSFTLDAAGSIASIDAGAGADTLTGKADTANTWTIGEFTSTVEGVTEFTGVENLVAGGAGDSFTLGANVTVASVTGGAGADSITSSGDNTWTITGADADVNGVQLTLVESLIGSEGADDFVVVADPTAALSIDGGAGVGVNTLTGAAGAANTWSLAANTLNDSVTFANINTLIGSGADTLAGANTANTWSITANNAGDVNGAAFEGMQVLQGGTAVDTMTVAAGVTIGDLLGGAGDDVITVGEGAVVTNIFAEAGADTVVLQDLVTISGVVDGGTDGADDASVDILDISAFSSANEFNFLTGESSLGFTRANFEQEIGAGGSSIFSGDGDFTWTFNADNTFTITGEGQTGTFGVDEYSSIRAGVGAHSFIFDEDARFAGNIQGDAAGNNALTANNLIDIWLISGANSGTMSGEDGALVTTFTNIANIIGGANAETFTVEAGGSIASIAGGAGADTLTIADAAAINNWQLGATNSVELVGGFNGIEAIVGNGMDDAFTVFSDTDVISLDGGLGGNNLSWENGDVVVDLENGQVTGNASGMRVRNLAGFAANIADANRMVGWEGDNLWLLSGVGEGSVASADAGEVAFSGFQELYGGSGVDELVGFDSAEGITWAFGANNYTDGVEVDFNLIDTSNFLYSFEKITGGMNRDFFLFAADFEVTVDGGGGENTVTTFSPQEDGVEAGSRNYEWQIGNTSGTVTSGDAIAAFSNVQSVVTGGVGSTHTIYVNDPETTVSGYSNSNPAGLDVRVSFINAPGNVSFALAGGALDFAGISNFEGNGADSEVVGDAIGSTWTIDTAGKINQDEIITYSNFGTVRGGEGDDRFILTGAPVVNMIGGEGAGVDTLQAADTENTWTIANAASSVNDVSFVGMEVLQGGSLVDTMTIAAGVTVGDLLGGAGDDVITVGEGATIANINAEAGSDTVTLGDLVTISGVVDGGIDGVDDASVDILDISAFSSANEFNFLTGESSLGFTRANFEQEIGTAGSSIFSGDGDFTWTFNADNTFTVTGEGQTGTFGVDEYSSIRAGAGEHSFIFDEDARFAGNIQGDAAGNNTLTANNLIDTWLISGANSGTMSGEEGALVTTFTNIANIIGSANAETFTVEAGGSIASISGGTGADILRIADAAAINNWQLGATNSVELVAAFDGIETIVGNELADTVNYAAGTEVVNIQGGAGEANVLVSADALAVNLGTGLLDETVSFTNINSFTAAGGSIAGADEANTWTLTAGDSGTVATATNSVAFTGFNTLTGGADVDTLVGTDAGSAYAITGENAGSIDAATTFSGMENLTAGAGADSFTLDAAGSIASIDAGAGADSLQGRIATANTWTIGEFASTVEGVTEFTGVENLVAGDAGDIFTLSGNVSVASITGGVGADSVTSSGDNTWTINGAAADVNGVQLTLVESLIGLEGTDDFVVVTDPTAALTIDGGVGAGFNTLTGAADAANSWSLATNSLNNTVNFANIDTLVGNGADTLTGANTANTWSINASNAGDVNGTAFEGMQVLQGGTAVDTMTAAAGVTVGDLLGGAGDDVITIGEGATIANIYGEAGSDTVTLGDLVTISGIVDGGTDGMDDAADGVTDILNISAFTSANEFNFLTGESSLGFTQANFEQEVGTPDGSSIFSGDGDFTWTFNADNTFTVTGEGQTGTFGIGMYRSIRAGVGAHSFIFDEDARFDGNIQGDAAGTNSLTANNLIDTWLISGANSGSMSGEDGALVTTFRNIGTIIGSANAETFTVEAGGSIESLSGGAGADILRIADATAINSWLLGATNSVELVASFTGVETVVGNDLADTFTFASDLSEVINVQGGLGADTLDVSGLGQDVEVSLQNATAATIGFESIETFAADSAQNATLIGMDATASWSLTAEDTGSVSYEAGTISYAFSGFSNATGGSEADAFSFDGGALTGVTDGGAGVNSLAAGNTANAWLLGEADGTLNARTFHNIQSVAGGDLADDFVMVAAAPQVQNVAGGLGNNSLTGFDQENAWTINADNSGTVTGLTAFTGIQSFTGGNAADTMTVAANTSFGTIDSGAGNDAVSIASGVIGTSILTGAGSDSITMEGQVTLASVDMGTDGAGDTSVDTIDLKDLDLGDEIADLTDAQLIEMLGFTLTGHEQFIRPEIGIVFAGDGFNVWHITGQDEGYFVRTDAEGNVEQVAFSSKHTLRGGAGQDVFVFASDEAAVSTMIEGGAGANRIALTWGEGGEATVQNLINEWLISGENSGTFTNEANATGNVFAGIGSIIGGGNSDNFVFSEGAMLSGGIDGGAGQDSLNLQALASDLYVRMDDLATAPAAAQSLRISNINQLSASAQQETVLLGASDQAYSWVINGANSGEVTSTLVDENNQLMAFENITAVTGGAHDDLFNVITGNNAIAINGGDAVTADSIDYSQVNANLRVALANLSGLELVRGNNAGVDAINTAELVASDGLNTWTIGGGDGVNDGEVTYSGQSMRFENFNVITGGAEADTFDQTDGIIIGEVRGGAGNDVMNVAVAGANRGTLFVGGADNDTLNVTGASAEHSLVYTASVAGGQFAYSLGDTTYTVSHEAVERVSEATATTGIEIQGTAAVDNISVGSESFTVNNNALVNHSNKEDVIVRAGISDTVEIAENITLAGTFGVINGSIVANDPATSSIVARELLLENTRDMGAFNARIRTNVDDLTLVNVTGDVFIQEQNGLNLAGVTTSGELDLVLINGDLTNSGAIATADDLRAAVNDGDILLSGDNQFNGDLTLSADNVEVHSASSMTIASLDAQALNLVSQAGITAEGAVRVAGDTVLSAVGNIVMADALNDFNRLAVTQAQDVTIVDQNGIELAGINTNGRFNLSAAGIVINGDINTGSSTTLVSDTFIEQNGSITSGADIDASAANGDVIVAEGVTTDGRTVTISASGNLQLQDVNGESINISGGELVVSGGSLVASAGDINVQSGSFSMNVDTIVDAGDGTIRISATDKVTTSNDVSGNAVSISGSEVTVDGNVTADQGAVDVSGSEGVNLSRDISASEGVAVTSSGGSVSQSGNISSDTGSIVVTAGAEGTVVMGADSVTQATNGDVTVSAGKDVVVGGVKGAGTVTIDSSLGGIIDGNGDANNVTSGKLVTKSDRGVGEDDALDTDARVIDSVAKNGDINLSNIGDTKIDHLKTAGGNVKLENTGGDVTLGSGSISATGGVGGSSVDINVDKGSVKSDGPQGTPTIVSDSVVIKAPGGSVGKGGLNIDAPEVSIFARSRAGLLILKPGTDLTEYFSGSFKFEDQLLAVEPLEEVNPAVFTNVQGYFYNDISLRMPADQRYDEEE